MSLSDCCVKGFQWDGTPEGKIIPFPSTSNQAYVTGSSKERAVLYVHDGFGWEYPNNRLLADHFAREADVTVYLPDFFNGEQLPIDKIEAGRFEEVDMAGFLERNSRSAREPEIFACAKKLRSEYKKLGAVGHCYGGWACFRLGGKGNNLIDCLSVGHPSLLTKEDVDAVGVPVQVLAPEKDAVYTPEMKEHTFKTLQANEVPFDYQHFPGVEHGCLVRGSEKVPNERAAMARGKTAAVVWFKQWLHE